MNWLTRYVAEVKRYLSRKGSDDIGDELESLLEDKIDARAECLGRGLTEDEVLALLKESGHPLKVAAGYNDSRPLISAILFPFYIKVIQNLILAASAVYLLSVIWVNLMGDYIEWPGFNFGTVWNFTVNWLVFITLGFFLAERYRLNQQFFEDWGPRELPSAGTQREEFATSISICIAIIIWLALLNLLSSDYSWAALSGQAENPVSIFTFWLKVQAVVVLAVYLALLFRPCWTSGKRSAIMLSDAAVALGVSLSLAAGPENLTGFYPALPPETTVAVTALLYLWLAGVVADFLIQAYSLSQLRQPS